MSKSEYELFRDRNVRERDAYLASLDDDEDKKFQRAIIKLQKYKQKSSEPSQRRGENRKRGNGDSTYRFSGLIPPERRKSQRIAKLPPSHTSAELIDKDDENSRRSYNSDSIEDLERIVFRPKKVRRVSSKNQTTIFLPVEEVTNEMIAKIAKSSTKKKYSPEGTSCHQCRQKTTDTKTVCRSGKCVGINGQMCGPCLKNRYGEDVATALMDPNWCCPFCKGICNCSFCRAHKGKRPTGILAPMALKEGFESVKHYLDSLNGYAD